MIIPTPLTTPAWLSDRVMTEIVQWHVVSFNKKRRPKSREVSHDQLLNGSKIASDLIRSMRPRTSFEWTGIQYLHRIENSKSNPLYNNRVMTTWLRIEFINEDDTDTPRKGWQIVGAEYQEYEAGNQPRIKVEEQTIPGEN